MANHLVSQVQHWILIFEIPLRKQKTILLLIIVWGTTQTVNATDPQHIYQGWNFDGTPYSNFYSFVSVYTVQIFVLSFLTFLVLIIQSAITNARKRPIENVDITIKRNPEIVAGNRPSQSEWTTNKKMARCFQENLQDQQVPKEIKEVQRERVCIVCKI